MTHISDEILAEKYGSYAGFESDISPAQEHYGEDPEAELKRLIALYIRPNSHILDLGCGPGWTLSQFAPHVQEAWGFDNTPELLASARARVNAKGLTNVTLVQGNIEIERDIDQLPDNTFDIVFTESGPDLTESLLRKLTPDAYFLQETGGQYSDYHLREIMGRKPTAWYAYGDEGSDQEKLSAMAALDFVPVCVKNYYYDTFFRDFDHLEAYVKRGEWSLSLWQLGQPMPYEPARDRPALELYARYNTTTRGIRMMRHMRIFVWRRAPIHYYPVGMCQSTKELSDEIQNTY